MSGDTAITLVGNLTADPELRFTQSGVPVADFTVASTPRVFDRASGEWKDGDAMFLRCTLWRQPAENVAETLTKGARVIVTGHLRQRSYETREGRSAPSSRSTSTRSGRPCATPPPGSPAPAKPPPRPPRPAAVVSTAAATRGPAAPAAGTTKPRSDLAGAPVRWWDRWPSRVPSPVGTRDVPRRGAGVEPRCSGPRYRAVSGGCCPSGGGSAVLSHSRPTSPGCRDRGVRV